MKGFFDLHPQSLKMLICFFHKIFNVLNTESSQDLLMKYLFDRGYLPGKCVSVRGIGVSWKIVCVRRTDRTSWKIHACSRNKSTLLENYKKLAFGKKEQIFSKTVSVAASETRFKEIEISYKMNSYIIVLYLFFIFYTSETTGLLPKTISRTTKNENNPGRFRLIHG